ncbi:MAG: hypothetical protein K5912_00300 [Alphaproteobacteria bacterium]|nr:hypothetical protein [Alphaproteobacteria bacterium]
MKIFIGLFMCLFTCSVSADTGEMTLAQKHRYISSLQAEISSLKTKISECERKTKGWAGATVFGAIGTAASGIGIGIQLAQKKKLENAPKGDEQSKEDNKDEQN